MPLTVCFLEDSKAVAWPKTQCLCSADAMSYRTELDGAAQVANASVPALLCLKLFQLDCSGSGVYCICFTSGVGWTGLESGAPNDCPDRPSVSLGPRRLAEEVLRLEGVQQQRTNRGLLGDPFTPRRLCPTARPALFLRGHLRMFLVPLSRGPHGQPCTYQPLGAAGQAPTSQSRVAHLQTVVPIMSVNPCRHAKGINIKWRSLTCKSL